MPPDTSDVDNALVATLGADATLLSYMPNGAWFDVAPQNSTRFIVVRLVDAFDEGVFGGRAIEEKTYTVLAVGRSDVNPNMKAAAARIDALLEDQPLGVGSPSVPLSGYTWMATFREASIRETIVDEDNAAISWFMRGGRYRVQVSLDLNQGSP